MVSPDCSLLLALADSEASCYSDCFVEAWKYEKSRKDALRINKEKDAT